MVHGMRYRCIVIAKRVMDALQNPLMVHYSAHKLRRYPMIVAEYSVKSFSDHSFVMQ